MVDSKIQAGIALIVGGIWNRSTHHQQQLHLQVAWVFALMKDNCNAHLNKTLHYLLYVFEEWLDEKCQVYNHPKMSAKVSRDGTWMQRKGLDVGALSPACTHSLTIAFDKATQHVD